MNCTYVGIYRMVGCSFCICIGYTRIPNSNMLPHYAYALKTTCFECGIFVSFFLSSVYFLGN